MKKTKSRSEVWSPKERMLRDMLKDLRKHGCVALKFGTESESNSFEEISYFNRLAYGILPVIVKIGGSDARNDIKKLMEIGVAGTIAPMVESSYGLKNYISAMKAILKEKFDTWFKSILIETPQAIDNISNILSVPESKFLNEIMVGRRDLSTATKKDPDDLSVTKLCKKVNEKTHMAGITTAVGGGITQSNARHIAREIKPDKVFTRYVVFDVKKSPEIGEAVKKGLEFEVALYEDEREELKTRLDHVEYRIKELKRRSAA